MADTSITAGPLQPVTEPVSAAPAVDIAGLTPSLDTLQPVQPPTPEQQYALDTERELQMMRNENYSRLPEAVLRQNAEKKALQNMEDAQRAMALRQATDVSLAPAPNYANYEKESARISALNEQRGRVGLAPLELPPAPAGYVPPAAKPAPTSVANQGTPTVTPEILEAISQPLAQAASEPTVQQVEQQISSAMAPLQAEKARLYALDEVDRYRQKSEQQAQARQAELDQKLAQIDARVRHKSVQDIFQGGSTGQKIAAALSIMAGGISQAFTGAKTNPVLDYMDKVVEQQSAKDKLSQDEKDSLRKQVYEQGQQEIAKIQNVTQNAQRKDALQMQWQELELKKQELTQKLRASAAATMPQDIFSGRPLTPIEQQQARANKDIRDQVAVLGNGKSFVAMSPTAKNELDKYTGEAFNALRLLDEYKKLGTKGSKFSLSDRRKADALRTTLGGALRVPINGPGTMQQQEYERLVETIGSPLSLTAFRPIEMQKLQQLEDHLKAGVVNRARQAGYKGDVFDDTKFYNVGGRAVREDALLPLYKQKYPTMSDEQIRAAIQKSIPGL